MNKEQYLRRLRSLIQELPKHERKTIIDFYREMIEDKVENGQTEAQVLAELGDVYILAQKILAENPNRRHYSGNRVAGIVLATFFAVLIIAGLSFSSLKTSNGNHGSWEFSWGFQNNEKGSDHVVTKTETASVAQTKSIYIDARNKEVTLTRGDGDAIKMTYQSNRSDEYTYSNTDGVMKLVNRYHDGFNFFNFFDWDYHSRITISVPEGYAGEVYLNTSNGAISVNDLSHVTKLTCSTSNGRITIDGVQAESVTADSSNGRISLSGTTASKVNADTSNAEISLDKLNSPDIELESSNGSIRGSIEGREDDYSIRTDTSNGSCTPGSRQGGSKNLSARTSNARIQIDFTE